MKKKKLKTLLTAGTVLLVGTVLSMSAVGTKAILTATMIQLSAICWMGAMWTKYEHERRD